MIEMMGQVLQGEHSFSLQCECVNASIQPGYLSTHSHSESIKQVDSKVKKNCIWKYSILNEYHDINKNIFMITMSTQSK